MRLSRFVLVIILAAVLFFALYQAAVKTDLLNELIAVNKANTEYKTYRKRLGVYDPMMLYDDYKSRYSRSNNKFYVIFELTRGITLEVPEGVRQNFFAGLKELADAGDSFAAVILGSSFKFDEQQAYFEKAVTLGDAYALFYNGLLLGAHTDAGETSIRAAVDEYEPAYIHLISSFAAREMYNEMCSTAAEALAVHGPQVLLNLTRNDAAFSQVYSKCVVLPAPERGKESAAAYLYDFAGADQETALFLGFKLVDMGEHKQARRVFELLEGSDNDRVRANALHCLGIMNMYGIGGSTDLEGGEAMVQESFEMGQYFAKFAKLGISSDLLPPVPDVTDYWGGTCHTLQQVAVNPQSKAENMQ